MIKRIQQGFTLIELMIVVAIIGILAAVAIPVFQDYTAKAQTSEAYLLLDGLKTPIAESISGIGISTGCILPPRSVSTGSTVASITVAPSATTATSCLAMATLKSTGLNTKVQGAKVSMLYDPISGSWTCGTNLVTAVQNKACQNPLAS